MALKIQDTLESGLDFFDYDENREISQLETQPEFEPSDQQLFETFEIFLRKWMKKGYRYSVNAINLADANDMFPEKRGEELSPRVLFMLQGETEKELNPEDEEERAGTVLSRGRRILLRKAENMRGQRAYCTESRTQKRQSKIGNNVWIIWENDPSNRRTKFFGYSLKLELNNRR